MKLYIKIMGAIAVMMVIVMSFSSLIITRQLDITLDHQMRYAASDMAKAISNMHNVGQLLFEGDPEGKIANQMNVIQKNTRYQYIIVMDMEKIQYSYPYESGLYKVYKNGGEDKVLTEGIGYSSVDTNAIISAVRAFEPIFYNGQQVGAVLVGLLTDDVYAENATHREIMEITLMVSLFIGLVVAVVLSLNIKKSMFGLEPDQIALMLSERNLIIHSIERGIVAIDLKGQVILSNRKANLLLGIPEDNQDTNMKDVSYPIFQEMIQVLTDGHDHMNKEITLDNHHKMMVNFCVMRDADGKSSGIVAGIESLTEVRALAEELTNYRLLVDSLRAQNHEFMNKLQTISGLLQLEEFEEALSFIDELSRTNVRLHQLVTDNISDHKLGGLILSKYNMCMENKIALVIDQQTKVTGFPENLEPDDVVTILGNLIDNSVDILSEAEEKEIYIQIQSDHHQFDLILENSGPPIDEDPIEKIFEKGYSTKGDHRGYGLYLVKKIVDRLDGTIEVDNEKGVKWHVEIDRYKGVNRRR